MKSNRSSLLLYLAGIRKVFVPGTIFLVLASALASLNAQTIVTELQAMKSVTEISSDGTEKEVLVPVTTILPGERVVYTLSYGNQGVEPVTGVVISLPVPEDMTLVAGSAEKEGTSVTYSVDGGMTFDHLEQLTITNEDGFERPARSDDVTAVRWTVTEALQPQQFSAVRCIAAVN